MKLAQCDTCARVEPPFLWWYHVDAPSHLVQGDRVPLDFCSVECLSRWVNVGGARQPLIASVRTQPPLPAEV